MKKNVKNVIFILLALFVTGVSLKPQFLFKTSETYGSESSETVDVPVNGMVTMVDLGADKCIPCKMMAPVIEKVEKKYNGKAAVVFIDVWKNKAPAKRFGIRAIPTQIFFDKDGRELYRHVGFMSEEEIDQVFSKMGVNWQK